ncbi:hypothetical protein FB451DRAFT_1563735 [Mycena latifolia]|nr:hypothetical protein FB451DRAFT_1563735 [Mycena latifolia]
MSAAELESVIVSLQNVVITRYVSAAGFVVLLYDHVLTLADEVEYVWSAPSTVAKILFLILRYMVPLFLLGQTITRSGLPVIPISDNVCKWWTAFATYTGWLSIVISNFLVLLRIWAMLPRGHRLITWSIMFFFVVQAISFTVTTWVVVKMTEVLVFEPLVGLCTFARKPNVVGLWVVGLFFEVVVFLTVCWNTLDRPRALGPASDAAVTRMLLRDGFVYFAILFTLRVANTIIAIVSPVSSLFVIVFFIWSATTLTTSRLIINSRRTAGKAERRRAQQMAATTGEMEFMDETDSTDGTRESFSAAYPLRPTRAAIRV